MQTITPCDLESIHTLKSSPNVEVTLCKKVDTGRLYIVKSIRLSSDSGQPRSEHALSNVVRRLGSPFLPNLHWDFEDSDRLYFVMVLTSVVSLLRYLLIFQPGFLPGRGALYSSQAQRHFPSRSCTLLRLRNCQLYLLPLRNPCQVDGHFRLRVLRLFILLVSCTET